ncbi:hypothetical protein SAMN05442782_1476 [Streptomyces sp. OK228]|nr:hypothetical protein SAMN05442782_1476 [Streptomyces sp. OK228]
MSHTLTWQRLALIAFTLTSVAVLLYTLGAPGWTGG